MPSALEELHSITQILHLTHHRNHNQHRLAKWYKAFNLLRRHISKLSSDLETCTQYEALSAKAKRTRESREVVEARVAFLEDVLVERCYLAFSQLVADNQYAALGLMLLACLARVRKVVAPLRAERHEIVGDEMMRKDVVEKSGMDFGEVITREEVLGQHGSGQDEEDQEERLQPKKSRKKEQYVTMVEEKELLVEKPAATKRPKKKRKKGDAFDDLFAGLV